MSRDKKLKKLGKKRARLKWWKDLASSAPVKLALSGIAITVTAAKLLSPFGIALDLAVGAGCVLLGAALAAAGVEGVSQALNEKIKEVDAKAVALLPPARDDRGGPYDDPCREL